MLVPSRSKLSLVLTVGLAYVIHQTRALPLVDSGLFVILGVSTCRDSTGYCLLGSDCTLDHDFSPDDTGGHCNGLRTAFTPAANFVCCKYNGADVKMPSTTTETPSTSQVTQPPPPKGTTPEHKPSKRPAMPDAPTKPQAPATNSSGGAIFWVDLTSPGNKNDSASKVKFEPVKSTVGDANTRPGSILTVSGAPIYSQNVPVLNSPSIANWIKPGAVMNIPEIVATKPGSTVTIGGGNELLDEIVHAVGSEVSHGVSITQDDLSHHLVSPSVQLDTVDEQEENNEPAAPVGSIETHEPKPTIEILKPVTTEKPIILSTLAVEATTKKQALPSSTTAKPVEEDEEPVGEEEDEDEEEDEEAASEEDESEEEEEEEEDDGLFGFADLVELLGLDTPQKAGAAQISAKNYSKVADNLESKLGEDNVLLERIDQVATEPEQIEKEKENATVASNLVGGFISSQENKNPSNFSYETLMTLPIGGLFTSTTTEMTPVEDVKEEEPPLCFGPVRQLHNPACWVVTFVIEKNGATTTLCAGARITKDLAITSASCAIKLSSSGMGTVRAILPASSENNTEITINEIVMHEKYHAAPRLALDDIGLVKLNTSCSDITDMDMGHCTLCLSQDNEADFSHLTCQIPQFYKDPEEVVSPHKVDLKELSIVSKNICDGVVKADEDGSNFPSVLCSAPPKSAENEPIHPFLDGVPLVCSGTRGIPFLAGVTMKSAITDWTIYTPVSKYVEWIRANEIPQIIKTVTSKPVSL